MTVALSQRHFEPRPPRRGLAVLAAQTLAYPIGSAILGERFRKASREFHDAQWLPVAELRARTDVRLGRLLRHAAQNVPFYRDIFDQLGLTPRDFASVSDLAALPVMSKARYRESSPERFLAINVPGHRRLLSSTSGSTGEPFSFIADRQALPVVFASHLFYDSWFNFGPFERWMRIVAPPAAESSLSLDTPFRSRVRYGTVRQLKQMYERWTQERFFVCSVDPQTARVIHDRIARFRPVVVMGYTSTLAELAEELNRQSLAMPASLHAVITIAENLTPARRNVIASYFRAPIINRYGLREFKFWAAQSCLSTPECFHVNSELVVWEVVREDGSPAAPGETGRLVLTDLHNYAMPFIRYDTGDLAVAGEQACSCGRGLPLISHLQGRSSECVRTPSGKVIVGTALGHFLFVLHDYVKDIREYQLIQETRDRARLLLVSATELGSERLESLHRDLRCLFGSDMDIRLERVPYIPCEASGKRPIIKVAPLARQSEAVN